ncbi:YigZ family protein [Corynebacterium poyangense]|uniref:YigZ family protein n=1 Tax=Corynebacterium poyangense TaxID=2684405 RepID=A0A7H0SPR1_9CORY|nr:YigZ family protein [Corynebacterium poyangense]QNQ90536.1 YigZ family protein [Corynebacterium poyangense]
MYSCPAENFRGSCEWEVQRSRFICVIGRIQSEKEARQFIDTVRREYPDARHHCHAFIVHSTDAQPRAYSSDDGEPAGTAGRPMLDVLQGSGLQDVVVVVVRYFGGIKLGTGGLVKAYSHSVTLGLELVPRVIRSRQNLYRVEIAHASAGKYQAEFRARGLNIIEVKYEEAVRLLLACAPEEEDYVRNLVAAVTQGEHDVVEAGQRWVDIPEETPVRG